MSSFEGTPGAGLPQKGSAAGSSPVDAIEKLRRRIGAGGGAPPPPTDPPQGDGEEEDDRMLRMSFLEHLEELRKRIIRSIIGIGVAFTVSLLFSSQLWNFVRQPARIALTSLGYDPDLYVISPMEGFNIVWFKLPLVCSLFLAFPWVLYQVWAFVSPGLYRRERRWAVPFILCSSGLFLLGGCFAYFVVFKYGLTFLLGIEHGNGVKAMVSITEYFDLFVNVMLGVAVVFELPILIFFLTLLRIVTPSFLIRHSRYAILIIFIIAAVVTPTPDVFNMMLFALPMCALFYVGIFAGYILVLHREHRKFPWHVVLTIGAIVLLLLAGLVYVAITKGHYKLVPYWPFLMH